MQEKEEWLVLKDIADELRIPERTLLYYHQQGDFPTVYRFGQRHRRVKRSDYENWKSQKIEK